MIALNDDGAAFSRETFAETLFYYHLLFETQDAAVTMDALRSAVANFDNLTVENEISLLSDAPGSISTTMQVIRRSKETELLMLEIIGCTAAAGLPMDRESVESFIEELFSDTR